MARFYLITLFSLIYFSCFGQVKWAPIGAKWYFNQPSSESGNYVLFDTLKDSIINGKNVREIEVKLNGNDIISREYLYQAMDSIFYFNSNSNSFHLLYNFSAKNGDTITVHNEKFKPTKGFFSYYDSIPYFKYKIISIDSLEYLGDFIKRQKVTSLATGDWGFFDGNSSDNYILNKIGSLTYFFGKNGNITPEENVSIIRCYNDSVFSFENPLWIQDCDFVSAIHNNIIIDDIAIFPNPFHDQLNIKLSEPIEFVEIYDISGLTLMDIQQKNDLHIINTSSLTNGFYILKIKTQHHIYSKKIIKISQL